ncbi:phosphopantetheine-binding protein [Pseudomonas sp. Irchel s3a18]|uniref:phosphopantetheine-binding protein n=2 Tax=unclassified Pseudomonas TaxID=196821 RepID=UPI000BA41A7C|nr:phosphopantetheine-binding protein [Pseudomonas sp. Irchel s3a18]
METTSTIEALACGIKDMLALESVDLDLPLSQIGIDSLNVVELILICQQVYVNVFNFDEIDIDENTTLREIDEQMLSLSV